MTSRLNTGGAPALAALLALLLPGATLAQPPTPQGPGPQLPPGMLEALRARQGGGAPPAPTGKPRPYADVITKDARSDDGLFKTHVVGDKYYFEIPKAQLGKELMWVTTLLRSQAFYGFGQTEVADRVLRFEKRDDKILVRAVSYRYRATDPKGDVERALEKANIEPILAVYSIAAYGPDDSVVIDASPVIYSDLSPLRFDAGRSFIEKFKSLPRNVEVEVTGTSSAPPAALPVPGGRGGGAAGGTVVVRHSIVALPENPMKPRLADSRVGFFATRFTTLTSRLNRVDDLQYIDRWRLEKKDPSAALSEPVKPITYYLGPEIPARWKPYVKKGVESWNVAFEKAGFKNAVVCRDIPTAAEDPDFDVDDIRYTVVRWLPSGTENAYGPHLSDPRTGEILNGSPKIFHNITKLAQAWYFSQASPNDKRAQKLPFPETLTGELVAYVVAHEIGHTLGFPHNMRGSSTFSVKQLRDAAFTKQWGTEASIMDYGRFNYVAQPGDNATLIPKIGPYDLFAVEWGYAPMPSAKTPDDETPMLNRIAARQSTNPMLRFGNQDSEDPTRQSEDLGDDSVEATRLGLKNIDRVLGYLVPATTRAGDDFSLLEEMYGTVLGQRRQELNHVVTVVGGVVETEYHVGQGGKANYVPVAKARQQAAVKLLVDNVFQTPKTLIRPELVRKFSAGGVRDRVLSEQRGILVGLMSDARLGRLLEAEAVSPAGSVYTVAGLMDDLRNGVFTELSAQKVTIDPYRRNLQREYVSALAGKINPGDAPAITLPAGLPPELLARLGGPSAPTGDVRALARGQMMELKATLSAASNRASDRITRLHLMDLAKLAGDALDPKK